MMPLWAEEWDRALGAAVLCQTWRAVYSNSVRSFRCGLTACQIASHHTHNDATCQLLGAAASTCRYTSSSNPAIV